MEFNKTAVVTGGSRGIGKAVCETLLEEGYQVVFLDVDDDKARSFLEERGGAGLSFRHCDVGDPEEISDVCGEILREFGTVSVLVNNAGIQTHSLFTDMSPEVWQSLMNIDLNSLFYVSKCFVPAMIAQKYGRIINMSSVSALRGSLGHVHYNTAKSGVLGFTRGLSCEIARYGITVNAVCPGMVKTDIIKSYMTQKQDQWLSEMHAERLGDPEDIAGAVKFLAAKESGWVTGQALHVNGGILTP